MNGLLNIARYPRYARMLYWRVAVRAALRLQGVRLGAKVRFFGFPIVSMARGSELSIGSRCVLCSTPEFNAIGVNHPVVLRTLRPDARIVIGDDCGISGAAICAAKRVEIGREVLLGANVVVSDTDFHPIAPENRRYTRSFDKIPSEPVVIEDNVFVGTGSVILKGVRIGRNAVIGAGSIVTRDVPADTIAAGNPARNVRSIVGSGQVLTK